MAAIIAAMIFQPQEVTGLVVPIAVKVFILSYCPRILSSMNEYRLVTIEFELLDATTTTTTSTPTGQCDGVPSTDWSCCSSTNTCSVGGGDCDNDSECASGLQCGNNNCKNVPFRAKIAHSGGSWR